MNGSKCGVLRNSSVILFANNNMSIYEDERNPMRIPDLSPMYEAVRDFVKENQGDKGFICTDNSECDTIWCIVYDFDYFEIREYAVKVIRVKNNTLEIIYDPPMIHYDDESIAELSDDEWFELKYSDSIYYIPTLFNIAENIQAYV